MAMIYIHHFPLVFVWFSYGDPMVTITKWHIGHRESQNAVVSLAGAGIDRNQNLNESCW